METQTLISKNLVSEKTVQYITRTAKENSSTEEEYVQKIIELTTAHNLRTSTRTETVLNNYASGTQQLVERLNQAQAVIYNTVRKLSGQYFIPDNLRLLAYNYSQATIVGIFKDTHQSTTWGAKQENLMVEYSSIENVNVKKNAHYLLLKLRNDETFKMPLTWLMNDPILVSKAVRKLVKEATLEKVKKDLVDAEKRLKELDLAQADALRFREELLDSQTRLAK